MKMQQVVVCAALPAEAKAQTKEQTHQEDAIFFAPFLDPDFSCLQRAWGEHGVWIAASASKCVDTRAQRAADESIKSEASTPLPHRDSSAHKRKRQSL